MLSRLIERLDAAVSATEVHAVTGQVRTALCDLVRDGSLVLPELLLRPHPDHYARRLLHRDPAVRYTAVVMAWGPGQRTPLHDHAGIWCVEAVVAGRMQVTRYDRVEERGDRLRFVEVEQVRAGVGSSGALIPPYEYHVLANDLPGGTSVTVHVYGGELVRCGIYQPDGDGTWARHLHDLGYDA